VSVRDLTINPKKVNKLRKTEEKREEKERRGRTIIITLCKTNKIIGGSKSKGYYYREGSQKPTDWKERVLHFQPAE